MTYATILETKHLCFKYPDGTHALQDVSIAIPHGKTVAILGGNGAGKSTLFLHLNGILKPSSGSVLYDGLPIAYHSKGLSLLRQQIGIVFQDPDQQLFSASVYQDVSFGVMNLGIPEDKARMLIESAIEHTGIDAFRGKPTHSLSYGQKKRVALAGIIAMRPKVLILDEPTAGLDPQGVSEIMKLIKSLQEELQISVILSTHDIDLVPLYCDYIYVLDQGRVVSEGDPDEIFSHPEELRKVHLRLPRIGHLMEILKLKDHFKIEGLPTTITEARRQLKKLF
ncbi:MAG: ATP-binding cassette domain-containing protein [Cellulosilyticaceae bacterium]